MADITVDSNAKDLEIVSIIDTYLSSPTSPSATAQELGSIIQRYLGPTTEDDWGTAWNIYEHIVYRAKRVPYDDTAVHGPLLDLLRALRSIPSTDRVNWTDLHPMGPVFRESLDIISSGHFGEGKEEWVSFNAFIAKVVGHNILDFDLYPIWGMRESLEHQTSPDSIVMWDHLHQEDEDGGDVPSSDSDLNDKLEDANDQDTHNSAEEEEEDDEQQHSGDDEDNNNSQTVESDDDDDDDPESGSQASGLDLNKEVPVAAVWIFYAGRTMWDFSQQRKSCVFYKGDRAAMGGARWKGSYGYSPERWKLWKIAFEELLQSQDLGSQAKDFASRALKEMEVIETS